VIDLTIDDDENGEDDDNDVTTEVSWLRSIRATLYRVRLAPPPLIDRFQIANNLPSPPTALPAKATRTQREKLSPEECTSLVAIVLQNPTAFYHASSQPSL
jgi:hypothetical protein